MLHASDLESITAPATQWQIVPQGAFSRHYDLKLGGETVVALKMAIWTEGCQFTIAEHDFAIRRKSLWKDGFALAAGDRVVCEAKRNFWSTQFELTAVDQRWILAQAGWFSMGFRLLADEREMGTIRQAGWFTRRRIADFAVEVPPPVQVFAIFLVLVITSRHNNGAAAGAGT